MPRLLRHRLHLLDAVDTPTIMYGARTLTTTKEHEKTIRTTQRRTLPRIIQAKRKYKKTKNKKERGGKDIQDDEMSEATNESGKEDSTNDEDDQDSCISFENDAECTSSQKEELEDWIGYMTCSEREAD